MEGGETRRLGTLYAGSVFNIAYRTPLEHISKGTSEYKGAGLTNFQRCFDIFSIPVIGSINTSFATLVSGVQIAHNRWTQSPDTVCLKAPPSFGHKIQLYVVSLVDESTSEKVGEVLTTGFSGETVHFLQSHCPSGM